MYNITIGKKECQVKHFTGVKCPKFTCFGGLVFVGPSQGVPFVCVGQPWTSPKISSHQNTVEGGLLHMLGTQPIRKSHMRFPVLAVFVFSFESLTEYLIWVPHTACINSSMHFSGSVWHNFVIDVEDCNIKNTRSQKKSGNLSNFY